MVREFKVGDKVRVITSGDSHFYSKGTEVTVERGHPNGRYDCVDSEGFCQIVPSTDIELIEYKFKVGDKVRLKEKKTTDKYYSITDSMLDCEYNILTIIEISENKWFGLKIEMDESRYYYHPSWLELVEEPINPLEEGAKDLKLMYDSFIDVGFTEDKAMELVLAFIGNVGK